MVVGILIYTMNKKPAVKDTHTSQDASEDIEVKDLSISVDDSEVIDESLSTMQVKKKMDNKSRNLIILILLFVFSIGGVVISHVGINKKFKTLETDNAKLSEEINKSLVEMATSDVVKQELDRSREEAFLNNKVILKNNDPTIALAYFYDLSDLYSSSFNFEFGIVDTGIVLEDAEVRFNKYVITGTANLFDVFSFIDQLERQPFCYSLETLALSSQSAQKFEEVAFSLEVKGYYTKSGIELSEYDLNRGKRRSINNNFFSPLLHGKLTPDDKFFMSLIDIEAVTIIALSNDKVFVKNDQDGIIKILSIGSQVKYGIMESIDWKQQEAVFKLNRYGVYEYIRIGINQKKNLAPSTINSDASNSNKLPERK